MGWDYCCDEGGRCSVWISTDGWGATIGMGFVMCCSIGMGVLKMEEGDGRGRASMGVAAAAVRRSVWISAVHGRGLLLDHTKHRH